MGSGKQQEDLALGSDQKKFSLLEVNKAAVSRPELASPSQRPTRPLNTPRQGLAGGLSNPGSPKPYVLLTNPGPRFSSLLHLVPERSCCPSAPVLKTALAGFKKQKPGQRGMVGLKCQEGTAQRRAGPGLKEGGAHHPSLTHSCFRGRQAQCGAGATREPDRGGPFPPDHKLHFHFSGPEG